MAETREQWLKQSRCVGCPHLRHDAPYFGSGPTFFCENHNKDQEFFDQALHGIKQGSGEILYRSCCPEEASK